KNRFGSTNEIGVFEMGERGLAEVANPSGFFLAERPQGAAGSVIVSSLEGTRPLLLELQALVARASFGTPRRTVLGADYNRVCLLLAVLEKLGGMPLASQDVFVNVAGGGRVTEPAADLGIVVATASSYMDRAIPGDALVLGEVGLTGAVRAVGGVLGLGAGLLVGLPVAALVPRGAGATTFALAALLGGYVGAAAAVARLADLDGLSRRLFHAAPRRGHDKVLDTSAIVDGRIADVCETGFVDGTLVVPRFVLGELQRLDVVVTSVLQTTAGRMIFGRSRVEAPVAHDG